MKFRVYRLPGSQRLWHVDTGQGTTVVNVVAFMSDVPVKTIDIGSGVPRAWVEIEGNFFVDRNRVGKFMAETATLLPCSKPVDEEKSVLCEAAVRKFVEEGHIGKKEFAPSVASPGLAATLKNAEAPGIHQVGNTNQLKVCLAELDRIDKEQQEKNKAEENGGQ